MTEAQIQILLIECGIFTQEEVESGYAKLPSEVIFTVEELTADQLQACLNAGGEVNVHWPSGVPCVTFESLSQ